MTSLVATESVTLVGEINSVLTIQTDNHKYCQRRHVLKSKENTYRHKCNKVLKRKLKKYKLRQDGKEDQDVLDVSKILVTSLTIKSPNNIKKPFISVGDFSDREDFRPKNYLFKMVRRKEVVKISKSLKGSDTEVNIQDATIDTTVGVTSQEKKQTNAFKVLMDSRNKSIGCNSPGKEKNNDSSDFEEEVERKKIKAKRHFLLQKMAEEKGSIRNKETEELQDKIIKKKMEKRAERLKGMILKDTKSVKENEDCKGPVLKKHDNPKIVSKDNGEVVNNNKSKKKTKTLEIVDIFNTIENPINISPEKKFMPKDDQEFLNKLSPSLKKKESVLCYFKKIEKDSECSPTNSENDNLIKVKLQPRNKKRGKKKKKLSLKQGTLDNCDPIEVTEENATNIEENVNISKTNKIVIKELDKVDKGQNASSKEQSKVDKINDQIQETIFLDSVVNVIVKESEVKTERQKRKRTVKDDTKANDSENNNAILNSDSRPKRSVKRPVKYVDDACLSSSDDELHIFTPKKKKHIESVAIDKKPLLKSNQSDNETVKPQSKKKVLKDPVATKKPAKLAPIFTPKQDPAALEAKQKFLQSGVPDKLKKIINQQKNNTIPDNNFPVVVHVQQLNTSERKNKLVIDIPLMSMTQEICALTYEKEGFKKLLHLSETVIIHNLDLNHKQSTQSILQNIKQLHPKFPVYRTYRYLRGKGKGEFRDCNYVDIDNSIEVMNDLADVTNDSPDRLNWTDKYKATSTNQIIGNFESIKELRKWLVLWTENELKSKPKSKPDSDSSDYYQSDTDSRDSMKSMNNLLIMTGPTGCGKTASVYAVASDLAMKVIEVNASSRRTGKIMLQDLQEATQSHKVNRGTGNMENSQKSQSSQEKSQPDLSKKIKKRGRPKKIIIDDKITKKLSGKSEVVSSSSLSQESTRTDSSLILIDDADIVFDQDDGFSSAIVQLVQCSKRPVILITSSLVCPHLQRFLQHGKILKMCPLLPRMLGTWLDIMCLADSGICWPGVGAKFLNYFKGDIRKTINYLQFCLPSYLYGVTSDQETASQNIDLYKNYIDDESSCMSWADNDESEGRTIASVQCNSDLEISSIWADFSSKHSNLLHFTYPVQLFNIWWSLPGLFTASHNNGNTMNKLDIPKSKNSNIHELEAMSNAIDALSLSDYLSHINLDSSKNITSQPWYYPEEDSVSERENLEYYVKQHEVSDDICQTMVTSSITIAQDVLGCERKTDISFPGMRLHRDRDKVVSRHKSLTSFLNVSAALDRRALALDYWPSCRTICRFEKSKNDTNMKRNNRFCHYLKSLSVLCKSDTFDNLCDSLYCNEGTELNSTNFNE